jgi:hypothetical protein
MRRPTRIYLVIAGGYAAATFAEPAEAHDYNDARHGGTATVQPVEFWPSGAWRYGVTAAHGQISRGSTIPQRVHDAQRRHARVSRRCTGAGLDITRDQHGQTRYHCPVPDCQAQIY